MSTRRRIAPYTQPCASAAIQSGIAFLSDRSESRAFVAIISMFVAYRLLVIDLGVEGAVAFGQQPQRDAA
jgi:hypothetical protein